MGDGRTTDWRGEQQAMIPQALRDTLEATGYLVGGQPAAATVFLPQPSRRSPRRPVLRPDAYWQSGPANGANGRPGAGSMSVFFKFAERADAPVADWQRDAWNLGSVPLLWVVSNERTDVYNGFGEPQPPGRERDNLVQSFGNTDAELAGLDAFAGRLAMETGRFWARTPAVNRKTGVDRLLLRDLTALETGLVADGLQRLEAQALIGRTIFAKYLVDRGIVGVEELCAASRHRDLPDMLDDREATGRFFGWLRDNFNGDMFPETMGAAPEASHLRRVARFLRAERADGQTSLFPYRFDVIPVELISSIYERFVHSASAEEGGSGQKSAQAQGVYYTPLTAVSMVLDEVFDGLGGDETVIDLTCGSGVFLVEALRRLVRLKANGSKPTREMIREALYGQVYGIDRSEAAVHIAAFSLYLAALELDPDPADPKSRRFERLVGRTLLAGDAHGIEETDEGRRALVGDSGLKKFDVVVGNPPWTYRGQAGTAALLKTGGGATRSPRGPALDFIRRGMDFAHARTKFGVLVSATHFFPRSRTGLKALQDIVLELDPVTLVNLSGLSHWLFDKAGMPALALLARHREGPHETLQLINVPRSVEGDRSRTIGATPGDAIELQHASWQQNQDFLKAGFLGRQTDLFLMDRLWKRCAPLDERLAALGARLSSGVKFGNRSKDAGHLKGLPFLSTSDLGRFAIRHRLPGFSEDRAERPRGRDAFRSPLVVVKEYLSGVGGGLEAGRLVAAVAERDLVYKDAYFGASFHRTDPGLLAHLVAGILGSALASWCFLMAGSSLGIWKPLVRLADVKALPAPDLHRAVDGEEGRRIVGLVHRFHARPPDDDDWKALDDAVFDLYQLGEQDRIVVSDGRLRATWQWKAGREAYEEAAGESDLRAYARGFLLSMDFWFRAANRRRLRAEIYDGGRSSEPLRVVRFVIEDQPPPSRIVVRGHDSLAQLLGEIDERLGISMAREIVGGKDLIVHSPREVVMVKTAARRRWMGAAGLDDARAVVAKSFAGGVG